MSAISYRLSINGVPAGEELLQAIRQIEVEDHADMADMVRLQIAIGVKDGCSAWSVVDEDVFPRLAALRIDVAVGSGRSETLINAYVVETNATFANQPGRSRSRASANQMRAAPSMKAKRTLAMPTTAEAEITAAIQPRPRALNASATGASVLRLA